MTLSSTSVLPQYLLNCPMKCPYSSHTHNIKWCTSLTLTRTDTHTHTTQQKQWRIPNTAVYTTQFCTSHNQTVEYHYTPLLPQHTNEHYLSPLLHHCAILNATQQC